VYFHVFFSDQRNPSLSRNLRLVPMVLDKRRGCHCTSTSLVPARTRKLRSFEPKSFPKQTLLELNLGNYFCQTFWAVCYCFRFKKWIVWTLKAQTWGPLKFAQRATRLLDWVFSWAPGTCYRLKKGSLSLYTMYPSNKWYKMHSSKEWYKSCYVATQNVIVERWECFEQIKIS
jgi:hypothetical protein